ncbi:hypothetical protein TRICI_004971 [Trichomonascus ciferrii]|uniref:ATP-dependent DNA helicase CHL1 n=1 Tax=Trichomonascus ciferrii TaxID=44093 RepID=A0A642UXZ7_9ASCO|nr:hypothetical protein TRICI_004971 [Trichomonascus ciferrii]
MFEDSLDVGDDDGPAWIRAQTRELRQREYIDRMREFEEKLQEIRKVEQKEKDKARFEPENDDRVKRRKKVDNDDHDEVYLVDDYESDSEKQKQPSNNKNGLSNEVLKLLEKIGEHPDQESVFNKDDSVDDSVNGRGTKIFFTSRTHSQLSQFVGQLRLTSFPPVVHSADLESESVKEIPLSSRKQLCIHPKVSKLRDTTQQNDACHEMQKKESTRCEFLLNNNKLSDRVKSTDFRNHALAQIRDIEDLADLGKEMNVCPYYESRKVIPSAEIVSLPYQLLLQKSSRKALNIDLKDSVVVIDEAHNILETMSSLYSLSVTLSQVSRARQGLEIYSSKFSKKLNGGNKIYLAQFIKVVSALEKFLINASQQPSKETAPGKEINQNTVLSGTAGLVNMYKLEKYLEKSKIAFKIETYLEKLEREQQQESKNTPQQLSLSIVCSFLLAISNPSSEGKLFYARTDNKELQLQYLLLDPSEHFREISHDARCVILAGGTMEPVNDYMNYLFPYVDKSDIALFSCNHVIPDENLSVSPLSTGPTKVEFLFTFAQRNSEKMMDELGRTLFNLSMIIPAGLVIFFPSYQYLDQLEARWKKTNQWDRLSKKKAIFREPKSASDVDAVLTSYSAEIATNSGAMLFSVVGGKMSEGINFSDNLARGIVMVGLPFPNLMSAEMIAKRDFIQNQVITNGGTKEQSLEAAKDFYENLCLRAVNQSIGRAIRHANDYASIILIDQRYNTHRIQKKLPAWIRKKLPQPPYNASFPEVVKSTSSFFKTK